MKQRHDTHEIVESLQLIVAPGQVTELRALDASIDSDGRWPATYSGYFDDPRKLAQAVATIHSAKGIYFVPNPVDPKLLARVNNRIKKAGKGEGTQDSNINGGRCLYAHGTRSMRTGLRLWCS